MNLEPFMAKGTMDKDLRILMLEDTPSDAELNEFELKEAGLSFTSRRVDTKDAFVKALENFVPDLILCDYRLPGFDGQSALQIAQAKYSEVPFIFVSGMLGEEMAVESLRQGATDYVLKDNLQRLGPVVKRALREAAERLHRKQAEQALAASEERFRALIEQGSDIVAIVDKDARLLYIAPSVERVLGYSPAELIGMSSLGLVEPDDVDHVLAAFAQPQGPQGASDPVELHVRHKDGSVRMVEVITRNLLDNPGVQGIAVNFRDITDRKQAEIALTVERNLLRTLIDNLPDYIFIKDAEGRYMVSNVAHAQAAHLEPSMLVGRTALELFGPELAPLFETDDHLVLSTGQALINVERSTVDAEGNKQDVLTTKVPLHDQTGKIVGLVGISRDVTQGKRIEEALRVSEVTEREQRLLAEALLDSSAALTSVLDPEVVMNRILENVGRVITHDAADIMLIEGDQAYIAYWHGYPADADRFLKKIRFPLDTPNLRQMLETRSPIMIDDVTVYPGWVNLPDTAWIRSMAAAPIQAHGEIIGFLNIDGATPKRFTALDAKGLQAFANQAAVAIENAQLYDELRRQASKLERRVEERTTELFQAKEHLESIFNSSTDAIVLVGRNGLIEQENPAFSSLFDYPAEEALGRPIVALVAPDSVEALVNALNSVVTEPKPRQIELVAQRKDGTQFDAELVLSPIVGPDLQTLEVICNVRDITSRKQMEIGLRQTVEKEHELGELKSRFLSMASHDFRTPLAVILSSASLMELYNEKMANEARLRHLHTIHVGVNQMTELLNDVLTFTQGEEGYLEFKPVPLDLEALCRELLEETQIANDNKHEFAFSNRGNCSEAVIDKKLFRQIINNLLSNAAKYSPEGSVVHFDLLCESEQAVIRLRDHGIGIPEKSRARLFEPFHRADNVNSVLGTGLGLAIVKRAVELHRGTVSFDSQVGVGTTFTVVIPTIHEAPR